MDETELSICRSHRLIEIAILMGILIYSINWGIFKKVSYHYEIEDQRDGLIGASSLYVMDEILP